MSESALPASHPIGLIVTDDLKRSRLTVFFRLLLAIPHFIWLELWSIAVVFAIFFAWIAGVVTGRIPAGLHSFIASYLRYMTHVSAYLLLLADPFPPFSGGASYPVDLRVDDDPGQSRLSVFFRVLLAIPAFVLAYVFRLVNEIVALLGWFYAIFTGRMNRGMRDLSAWLLRYEIQTYAYVYLVTGRYPSLAGAPTV